MLVFENLGLASLLRGIEQYDLEALALLWSRLQAHPELAIWLYLAIVVSNTMLPSAADRSAWVPVGLILGFLAVATMLFGLGPEAAALISSPLDMFLRGFAGLFTLTIALDIMLIVPLMIVQQFVRWFVRLLT
jgi:hypothetical protein